ncbi:transcriptional regulator, TetR family [Candidatus Moduliflexus flocculans]|uniref:Transcriptional regulator, TetR family n=1 Tax=Candidatus Moduliflexus flocculans TaxID=1499966 RepID=A0A081BMK7_9BACT|nr:transcriptional regulator, TetR family [Candidatus Moduliflexus flocculans]
MGKNVNTAQKPDKRIAILEATLELIAEQGFHNTPTSQIAEKAEIGVGTIYRYFQDKDDLIHKLFEYVIEKENEDVLREYNPKAPFRERYLYLCARMIQFAARHPKESSFLEQYFHSPYGLSRRREDVFKQDQHKPKKPPLAILFDAAIAQQVIKDLPPYVLGALTFGPIFELIRDINAGIVSYDTEMIARAVEACWDAIKR